MEIVINSIDKSKKISKDKKGEGNTLTLTLNSNNITSIMTDDIEKLKKIISLDLGGNDTVLLDGKELTEESIHILKRKISIITDYQPITFLNRVLDYMNYTIISKNLKIKNPTKKIIDSLKIVGLDEKYLLRELYTLSSSEKELIQLAIGLLSNPEILVLTNQFSRLDMKNKKKVYLLLQRLRDQYQKIIVFINIDTDTAYKYSNKTIIIKNNKVLLSGDTEFVYSKVDLLSRNKFRVPEIAAITYKAIKTKKVKLDYHNDIRDIIKDIYKHV